MQGKKGGFWAQTYLAVNDGVLSKNDDFSRCRDHEGRHHGRGLFAFHFETMRQVAVAIYIGGGWYAIDGNAVSPVSRFWSKDSHVTRCSVVQIVKSQGAREKQIEVIGIVQLFESRARGSA